MKKINQTTPPPQITSKPHKGFALVATVLVMSMLMLLCVSMLSISSVTTKSANVSNDQQIAESNARMAAMIALGELQEYMGPDQRVSANAAIYDTSPDTIAIDGVKHPHWLGAYKTTFGTGNEPMIYSDNSKGGYLKDRRGEGGSGAFNHRDAVLKFLVSGTKANDKNEAFATHEDPLKIISATNDADSVYVPKVVTKDGAYAYHVKDLGQTAPVYQYNPIAGDKIEDTETGQSILYTGSHRPYNKITETQGSFDHLSELSSLKSKEKEFKNLTLPQGIVEAADANSMRQLLKQYVHDLDLPAEALMVDTVRSGFKIDLTPYLKQSANPGAASLKGADGNTILTDSSPLIDESRVRFGNFSPKFGILRSFANLGQFVSSDKKMDPRPPIMGSGKDQSYPSYKDFVDVPVHPYITEFSVYVSMVTDTSSPSGLSMLFYPRVTLYNPHNVTLKAADYFVQINRRLTFQLDVPDQNGDGTRNRYTLTSPYWGHINNDPASARKGYLGFYLDPIEMAPGEALVFTPKDTLKELEWLDGNLTNNLLSARVSPDSRNSFSKHVGGLPKYDKAKGDGTYKVLRFWQNGYHVGYGDSTSARLRLDVKGQRLATYSSLGNSADYPIVHTLDAQNWRRGNEGKWRDINKTLPLGNITSSTSVNPVNRSMLGFRMKAPEEASANVINAPNGFWKEAIINNYNLRAGVHRRSPLDHLFAVQTVLHEYAFGPYTPDNQEQPDYTSAFMKPSYRDGKYKFSPLLGSAGNGISMPLFDIPTNDNDFYSIGQFRSTPLTQAFDQPSIIIGESIAPRNTPRGQTAMTTDDYVTTWENSIHNGRVTTQSTWWDADIDPASQYSAYDIRFESNHALWDTYFMSTYDSAATSTDGKFKNKKFILTEDVLDNAADRIAKYIKLKGHLNVNSTSVLAWKSILMMNAGIEMESSAPSESSSTPFPGLLESDDVEVVGNTSSLEDATWNGYRTLSEQEATTLAEAIVAQVKKRAPFIGVSDFVNRRLINIAAPNKDPRSQSDEEKMSYAGPIDVAIMESDINSNMKDYEPEYDLSKLVTIAFGNPGAAQGNQPTELFSGAATHLSQGKILQTIGANLTARSDTFKIRAYGESRSVTGTVLATAVCEIIVQRSAQYMDNSDAPETKYDDLTSELNKKFGRKFNIVSFKWLTE